MSRGRLVCGITDATVQKQLLSEKELCLEIAISLAQSVEIAEQGTRETSSRLAQLSPKC